MFCLICPVDRVLSVLSHLSSGPCVRCSVSSVQWTMCYTSVLSPQSRGPCDTLVFCHLCPVDHVLHRCSVTSVQWTMCYTGCSVTFVQWTMCYTGVLSHLSIGPCATQVFCPLDHVLDRCSVTSVQCTLWYTGVLSSGPCDTHTFCHICPVDHVVCRCSVTCVHLRSVTSVQWTMCYLDVLWQLLSNSPCVCYIGFSVHLSDNGPCVLHRAFSIYLTVQWTMCVLTCISFVFQVTLTLSQKEPQSQSGSSWPSSIQVTQPWQETFSLTRSAWPLLSVLPVTKVCSQSAQLWCLGLHSDGGSDCRAVACFLCSGVSMEGFGMISQEASLS